MKALFRLGGLVFVLGAPPTAWSQEVKGFGEVRGIWYAGTDEPAVSFVERFRPTLQVPFSERVSFTTTIETSLQQGWTFQKGFESVITESDFGPLLDAAGCTWPTETNAFLGISSASDVFQVDRLFVDWYHPKFDLRVGRQALQWGSAQFINPTDPFPELLLMEPWRPRSGVNAALMTVPIKDLHDFNVVVASNDTFDALRLASRVRLNWNGTDFALVGAYRGDADNGLVGLDIRGTLGVGYWLESAVHIEQTPWFEVVAGVDYSFPLLENLILSGQYYYNGADSDAAGLSSVTNSVVPPDCDEDVDGFFGNSSASERKFGPMLTGAHYGLLSASLGVVPELSLQGAWLQNFSDGSAFVLTTVSVRPTGWLDVSLSAQLPARVWGEGGEFSPREEDLVFEQEMIAGMEPLAVDFSGLVPRATVIIWTRANF